MSTTLTPVPDCEESPIVIGATTTVAGAVCGADPADPNDECESLRQEMRNVKAELAELMRQVRLLRRLALKRVEHPTDDMTGVTYDGNDVTLPAPL